MTLLKYLLYIPFCVLVGYFAIVVLVTIFYWCEQLYNWLKRKKGGK
jgi:hypothetical protein